MKTHPLFLLLQVAILASCSTPMEKAIKRHERNGDVIIKTTPTSLYVYGNQSLYIDKIETQSQQILIDFSKGCTVTNIYPYFAKDQTKLCTKEWVNDYIDFVRKPTPSSYKFTIWDNLGIHMKGVFDNGCTRVDDELLILFSNIDICYEVEDARCELMRDGTSCVSFVIRDNYWNYGTKREDDMPPKFPLESVNAEAFSYWQHEDWKMPIDTFTYSTRVYMNSWGKIFNCEIFYFEKLNKKYTLHDMLQGRALKDVNDVMVSVFNTQKGSQY